MNSQEILHKNEKLTKRLLELKSEKHKLTIRDKLKLNLLNKYNIPVSESDLIDTILRKEGHIKFAKIDVYVSSTGARRPIRENPFITEQGLKAIKCNYYEFSHIINTLKTPQAIANIMMTILIIISTSIGICTYRSTDKLEDTLERQKHTIDSLKTKTNEIETTVKNIIKNTTNDTLYIKDTLGVDIQSPKLIQPRHANINNTVIDSAKSKAKQNQKINKQMKLNIKK